MCNIGIGTTTEKLDIHLPLKVNKFDLFIMSIFRWYMTKINFTVTIYNKYDNKDPSQPDHQLFIYGNGNIGI